MTTNRTADGPRRPAMTPLLAKAFARAAELPEPQQDGLAAWLLDEIEQGAVWLTDEAAGADEFDDDPRAASW